jgi:hypothetical protein
VAQKGLGVSPPGAAAGADLGGSSKESGEIPEDRCGVGFRGAGNRPRVSRS